MRTLKTIRIDRCKKHNLVDILMLVFVGVLCGYKSIEQIPFYAQMSINVLKKYLKLENGIACSNTILRVLARIKPAAETSVSAAGLIHISHTSFYL